MLINEYSTRTYAEEIEAADILAAYLEDECDDELIERLEEARDTEDLDEVIEEIYKEICVEPIDNTIYIRITENRYGKNGYVYIKTEAQDWLYWARSENYGKTKDDKEIIKELVKETTENLYEHIVNSKRAMIVFGDGLVKLDEILYM